MNDYFNVRSFGAVGDGIANDTTKIQAAINALPAGGGTIYFPPGSYKITATLAMPDKGMIIRGSGGGTILNCSVAGPVFTLPILTAERNFTFEYLTFDGASTVGLEALRSNQSAAFAFQVMYNECSFENIETILNVAAVDTSYVTNGSFVYHYCCDNAPNLAGAHLLKSYVTAGNYPGGVDAIFQNWVTTNVNTRKVDFFGNFEAYASAFYLKTASVTNGGYFSGCSIVMAGTFKTFGGTGLGKNLYDVVYGCFMGATGSFEMGYHDSVFIYSSTYGPKVIISGNQCRIIGNFFQPVGTGIALDCKGVQHQIIGNHFDDIGVSGATTLLQLSTTPSNDAITGNQFTVTTVGTKTIVETAGGDYNSITGNTGTTAGAGMTLVGAATIAFVAGKNIN
jgi:hypothetical protein